MKIRCQRIDEILSDEVWFVTWSPNGKYFATSGKDGTLIIWLATFPHQQEEEEENKNQGEEEEEEEEEGKDQEEEKKEGEFVESEEDGYFQDFMNPSSWGTPPSTTTSYSGTSHLQPDDNDPLYFFPLSQTATGNKSEMFAQQNLNQEYEQEEEKGWEGMGNPFDECASLDSVPPRYAEFFSKCPTYTEDDAILPSSSSSSFSSSSSLSFSSSSSSSPSPLSPLFFESFSEFIEIEKQHTLSCGGAVTWHAWSPDSQFILASLLNGEVLLYHAKTGTQVLRDKALLDTYPQWAGSNQFLLCSPEERRRSNTEKFCIAKKIVVEKPKGGEGAPPRVEYEKTCQKCKGSSTTVVFDLDSSDYLRFLNVSPSGDLVSFVRDFAGQAMDEVVVLDRWWGRCKEGEKCVRNDKPRVNLRGQDSSFPPLLRTGFVGNISGISLSPNDRWLAVVIRLFSGVHPQRGIAQAGSDPTTYQRIAPPSEIEKTAALRVKLLLSNYSTKSAPQFEKKVDEIIDSLRKHWLSCELLTTTAHTNTSNKEQLVESALQNWLISQYLSWTARPQPPLKHTPIIYLIDLTIMRPVAYLEGMLDSELAIFENQCLFWPSFSPDGRFLLTGSGDAMVCIYDISNLRDSSPSPPNLTCLSDLRKAPLPFHLPTLSSYPEEEERNELKGETPIARLKGHTLSVSVAAVHPTRGVILSVSDDRSLCIWQGFEN